jgi:hypothetical protein
MRALIQASLQISQVIEEACYCRCTSKPVYISKLAQHVRAVSTPEGLKALLVSAGISAPATNPSLISSNAGQHLSSKPAGDESPSSNGRACVGPGPRQSAVQPKLATALEPQHPSETQGKASREHGKCDEQHAQHTETMPKVVEQLEAAAEMRRSQMVDAGANYAGPYAELRSVLFSSPSC